MLKFHMQAPLGYQVHMVSTVNFVFADEEKVMAELVKVRKCLLEYEESDFRFGFRFRTRLSVYC